MAVPFDSLVFRWQSVSQVPIFVGSAPEKTPLPYVTLNEVQSNDIVLSPSNAGWTESLVQIDAVGGKLIDASDLSTTVKKAYQFYRDFKIADMTLLNSGTQYSRSPNISGNRGWISTSEYRIRF